MGGSISEEDVLGKAYDRVLTRRLLSYAKPYRNHLIGAIALTILSALVQIVQPYLIKIGIDRYIVHRYKLIDLRGASEEIQRDVIANAAWLAADEQLIADPHELDPRVQRLLEEQGRLGSDILIPVKVGKFAPEDRQRAQTILATLPNTITAAPGGGTVLVPADAFKSVSPEDLQFLRQGDIDGVSGIGLIYFATLAASFLLGYAQLLAMAWIGQQIMCDIRIKVFRSILSMPMRFFTRHPVGRLVTRTTNDVTTLNEMFTSILVQLFQDVTKLIGITAVLLWINWKLVLVTFSVLPFIVFASWFFSVKMRESFRQVRIKLARINSMLSEHLAGVRVVQLFRRERVNAKQFANANKELYDANMRQLLLHALFSPVMAVLRQTGIALIIWYGGGEVVRNALPLGALVAFLTYLDMFFQPILELSEKYNILQASMAASERIFQILDQPREFDLALPPPPALAEGGRAQGSVEFRNVRFAYKPDEWVLRDVSFSVEPGQTVALVGATGSGKTTVIKLLARLYDPDSGQILLDGQKIQELDPRVVRGQLAVVMQDVFLFAGDVISNIRLNSKDISQEKIEDIARHMNADEFIRRLPGGYQAEVTERGSTLSMGQRQLLAFARALAFNPPILVLDEATSNVDTETELLIQDALRKLMSGRTSLVIAHRLSTIQHADKILVFHKGQICEAGNHQQLLAKRGLYYRLYQLQFSGDNGGKDATDHESPAADSRLDSGPAIVRIGSRYGQERL